MDKRSFGPHAFFLIDEYDSRKPWDRPNFLEGIGRKVAYIEGLRALRDSLEAAREPTPEATRRRRSRSPRPPRVIGTRPANRSDIRYAARRRRTHPVILVIFIIGPN